jgi:hypothetical protein
VIERLNQRFRFRPARPGTAAMSILLGAGLLVSSLLAGSAWTGWAAAGAAGLILGVLYFASPAWSTEVRVDEEAIEVLRRGERRFRLRYDQVVTLTVAAAHRVAFVDGGSPDRSLLLPGRGARAPYRIENQPALYAELRARVAPDRQVEVDRLDRSHRAA